MSRSDEDRLLDIVAVIEAIGRHVERGGLEDGLIFDAVRARLTCASPRPPGRGPCIGVIATSGSTSTTRSARTGTCSYSSMRLIGTRQRSSGADEPPVGGRICRVVPPGRIELLTPEERGAPRCPWPLPSTLVAAGSSTASTDVPVRRSSCHVSCHAGTPCGTLRSIRPVPRLGSERQGKVGDPPYTDGMSGERDELARLVQEIPDAEIPAVLAEVRRRLTPAVERPWPPAFFGSIRSGRTDTARRVDEALAEGFGRS